MRAHAKGFQVWAGNLWCNVLPVGVSPRGSVITTGLRRSLERMAGKYDCEPGAILCASILCLHAGQHQP
jgi:hypothetical protein